MKYKVAGSENNEAGVLNEVHFYIAANDAVTTGTYKISVNDIEKIEVLGNDKLKTAAGSSVSNGKTP